MENVSIKEKLQEYLDAGNKKLLKLIYAVAKGYSETKDEYELTDEQILELAKEEKCG